MTSTTDAGESIRKASENGGRTTLMNWSRRTLIWRTKLLSWELGSLSSSVPWEKNRKALKSILRPWNCCKRPIESLLRFRKLFRMGIQARRVESWSLCMRCLPMAFTRSVTWERFLGLLGLTESRSWGRRSRRSSRTCFHPMQSSSLNSLEKL